jgi:hypothetical protein
MTGNLAIFSNRRVFLDFNKRSDLCVVSNFASVEIDKFGKPHSASQLYVWRDRAVFIHHGTKGSFRSEVLNANEASRRPSEGAGQANFESTG